MTSSTLNTLMVIQLEGPSILNFKPRPAIEKWFLSGMRKRRPGADSETSHSHQSLVSNIIEENQINADDDLDISTFGPEDIDLSEDSDS